MHQPQSQEWKAEALSQQHVADYKPFNFVDGEGVRCSLYLSGCRFACEECFNEAVQDFSYGRPFTAELLTQILTDLDHDYVQGLTLLGGEPFLNTQVALTVVRAVREKFGQTKDIWSWSGFTFEQLLKETADKRALLRELDVLVDGPFMIKKKDLNLQFRGSSNQRIIDVPRSLAAARAVLWDRLKDGQKTFEQLHKEKLI